MSRNGETDQNACNFNDFALVRIDDADKGRVNPTIPTFGGPSGLRDTSSGLGNNEPIYSYGNSVLRQGLTFLSPKYGLNVATQNGGWDHNTYTFTPGIPGDSGSGFVDRQGRAYGVLSTLQFAPRPFSNGVADLPLALRYLRTRSSDFPNLRLVPGTAPFRVALPGLGSLFGGGAKAASQRSVTLKDLKA
ncbi:Trypsin-like cysteine/serine peptidase domain [Ceraceosorus bombacis]|uniref:Trypsin-like cysteine/serine peptidase domain n=1 Tax=Ceraceosorus bombacis TaxID=401625 RepID=A0A0P1BKK3_9BASI|nr:Trypsin-like cysteine/serine peptidase domain [Ceraceosorus bombacis]